MANKGNSKEFSKVTLSRHATALTLRAANPSLSISFEAILDGNFHLSNRKKV